MPDERTHDLINELNQIRNQLSYTKRLGFFFGAGTSKSLGISDIFQLTEKVESSISDRWKDAYALVKKCMPDDICLRPTVEDILNQIRLIRQITYEKSDKLYDGISGEDAKNLDIEICDKIYDIILAEENGVNISPIRKFIAWLNWLSRDYPKEIFTTNYDLVFEKAMESLLVPYFDGFVGSNEPFFLPESLEADKTADNPPASWIRLWKLHGSLGWFWKPVGNGRSNRIVRLGEQAKKRGEGNELVIYPSREKYESSRKQPFIAYFDRFKTFLKDGEKLFIINGYSFSDDHINAQIFDCLRQNNRLHIIGFFFSDATIGKLVSEGFIYPNFSALGSERGIINAKVGKWIKSRNDTLADQFWDNDNNRITLGDFNRLVEFFLISSGKREKIETMSVA